MCTRMTININDNDVDDKAMININKQSWNERIYIL